MVNITRGTSNCFDMGKGPGSGSWSVTDRVKSMCATPKAPIYHNAIGLMLRPQICFVLPLPRGSRGDHGVLKSDACNTRGLTSMICCNSRFAISYQKKLVRHSYNGEDPTRNSRVDIPLVVMCLLNYDARVQLYA